MSSFDLRGIVDAPVGAGEPRTNGTALPAARDAILWPTLDSVAYCGLVGEIVLARAETTEADPIALLTTILVGFGSMANSKPHVRVGGAVHPMRLYATLVGSTSRARKGQSFADTRPLFEAVDPGWAADRVMGGLSTGEGAIAAVRDGAGDDDPGVADKRLLAYEPEFARVLTSIERETNTLSHILRQGWDSDRLRVMTRKDPLCATGAHISVLGHVTVDEVRRKLTNTDAANGFGNRFLWPLVKRSQTLPFGADYTYPPDQVARFRRALDRARTRTKIERSAPAAEHWCELYREMANDEGEGIVGSLTARAEAQVLRLSLTYAMLDGSEVIDVEHQQAAYALWRYSAQSVRYIFGTVNGDPVLDRLFDAIRAAGPAGLDQTAQNKVFSGHQPAQRLARAREVLEAKGLIRTVAEATAGANRYRSFIEEKAE